MKHGEYGKHGKKRQSCTLRGWCLIRDIELTPEDWESMKLMAGSALEDILFEEGLKFNKIERIKELFISRFCGK